MRTLYLDESGDPNERIINPNYPVFVLGGIILDGDDAHIALQGAVSALKLELFGRDDFILHTSEIVHRQGIFQRLNSAAFRAEFLKRLNRMMSELDYSVLAVAKLQSESIPERRDSGLYVYTGCFGVLVDRYIRAIGRHGGTGDVVVERRGPRFDGAVRLEWRRLRVTGTRHASPTATRQRLGTLSHRGKPDRVAGLELADLVLSPIGRHLIGKEHREDWEIVSSKILTDPDSGSPGWGLITLTS